MRKDDQIKYRSLVGGIWDAKLLCVRQDESIDIDVQCPGTLHLTRIEINPTKRGCALPQEPK